MILPKLSLDTGAGSGDRRFERSILLLSFAPLLLLLLLVFFLLKLSLPAIRELGFTFFTSTQWNPAKGQYGALPFIHGTLLTSLFALVLAVPVSVATALYLVEMAPKKLAAVIGFFVELLASIPSVIFGLWGLTVVAPAIRVSVQPFLAEYFGWTGLFNGMPYGVGVFSASLILAIMIIPTITSICIVVFKAVPVANREAALAIGATQTESIFISVLRASTFGIFAAVLLGWGRALGETMAVTMLIGNRNDIATSLFAPAQTIASLIANEYAEASSPVHIGSLAYLGLTLFALSFFVNFVSKKIIQRKAVRR